MSGKMLQVTTVMCAATALAMVAEGADLPTRECEADHECSNGFCYVQIGKCMQCTNCSYYLRHAAKWISCAKTAQECGSCFDGFEEEVLERGAKREICVSQQKNNASTFDDGIPVLKILCYSLGAGVVLLIILIAVLLYYKRGHKMKPECLEAAPPPLYTSLFPLPATPVANVEEEIQGEISEQLLHVVETRDSGSLQKAVPFQDPYPPYSFYNNHEESDDQEEEEVEEVEDDCSDIDYHNAETMPSDWTPGDYPDYATVVIEPPETEQGTPEEPSSTSSLSSLSEPEASTVSNQVDSGVSASSSSQSVSSSSAVRYFQQFGVDFMEGTSSGTVTMRSRSEDNIISSNPAVPPKRARRDSGSVSMQSGPSGDEDEGAQINHNNI